MSAIMGPEVEQPKVEVLKLPNQEEWRNLLEFFSVVLNDEIVKTEDAELANNEKNKLPPFLVKRFSSDAYTEDEYALQIINDLFNGKELNSYVHTIMMINHHSNSVDDLINHKKAWKRVSKYLRDYDTLLRDTNEMGQKHDFVMWEKPSNFTPINLDLQPQLLPNI